MPENMTAEDFATADDAVITTSSTLTDEKILQEAIQTEEIVGDDKEMVAPRTRNVENSLEILKNLSLFSEKRGDQVQELNKFKTLLTRYSRKVQASKNYVLFCKRKKSSLSYSLYSLCLLIHLLRHD